MNLGGRLAGAAAAILLIAGCGASGAPSITTLASSPAAVGSPSPGLEASVATYRGNAARTGLMPGPGPSGRPVVDWTFDAGAPIGSSPAVLDGIVYLLSNDGVVHALALTTGAELWRASLGAEAAGSPLVTAGLVIVGDSKRVVHALSAGDGSARWTVPTDGPIAGAAAATSDIAVVATTTGSAYAIEIPGGTVRWKTAVGGAVGSSVAIGDGLVYLGAGPNLVALALADGRIRWKQSVSAVGRIGTPTAADGLVFAATGLDGGDASVYGVAAIDAATGASRWRFVSPSKAVVYTPAVVSGRAYIVGEDRRVTALDAATGTTIWSTTTEQVDEAVAAVVDGIVYVAGNGGAMNALDATTGAIRWSVAYRGIPYGPTVVGGYVLVGTDAGTLVAIGGSAK
jgi:eukaryotic-like serine/threonine-protein kinase